MKKNFLLIAFVFAVSFVSAQDFTQLIDIEIKTAEQCRSYDSSAWQCANYIIDNPNKAEDINRLSAITFLMKWMASTPDYNFLLDANAAN
jgi:hypothetical protein